MPAAFTHLYFGSRVLNSLEPELQKRIHGESELFYLGLQGPDILFFYHPLKKNPVSAIGYRMHQEQAYGFFKESRSVIEKSMDREAALVYMLGFICHFTLDSECHGYIADAVKQTGVSHGEIEQELDKYLLRKQRLNPKRFDATARLAATERNAKIIAPFFGIDPGTAAAAVHMMKRYTALLRTLSGIPKKIVFLVLRLTGSYDSVAGMFLNPKDNPLCRESNRELERRAKHAEAAARQLIASYLDYTESGIPLPERFERNYE